ncbi:MAG: hypothetical protein Q9184_003736 [Pyrenodesmia sp. 2 TL-2023]
MAYAQALSVVGSITNLLDPEVKAQTALFAILGALSLGLAFLTSLAIGLGQAPGIARSLWPSGDASSKIFQIGKLNEQLSNITEELSDRLSGGLELIMKDPSTFAAFADNGRYSNNDPPLDPNEIKTDLALSLQTYLVSESMKQNEWYAIPLKISTKEEYDAREDPPCPNHMRSICPGRFSRSHIYWSPASGRQYKLQERSKSRNPGKILLDIPQWANLPLLFDGAFNCTALGQRDNQELVHVNYDGTLDISCLSQLPILIQCGVDCPQTDPKDGSCHFQQVDKADCKHLNMGGPRGGGGLRGGEA